MGDSSPSPVGSVERDDTFQIYLHRALKKRCDVVEAPLRRAAASARCRKAILVVEDDDAVRRMTREVLEDRG